MKSTPMLMQDWGIRATLAGIKTQTRRARGLELINQNPDDWQLVALFMDGHVRFYNRVTQQDVTIKCRYGGYGDKLLFKETWRTLAKYNNLRPSQLSENAPIEYKEGTLNFSLDGKWRSAMFMCRWMSHLSRTIIKLRCERLQNITEADAIAEGVDAVDVLLKYDLSITDYTINGKPDYRKLYLAVWNEINGKKLPASKNPWVFVPEWENKK